MSVWSTPSMRSFAAHVSGSRSPRSGLRYDRNGVIPRVTPLLVRERMTVDVICTPRQVYEMCHDLLDLDREVFRVFHFDTRGRVISMEDVSRGIANASLVHPREVFRGAILAGATHIILAHNHPAGDPTPSTEDKDVTRRVAEAGRILGVPAVDHVIIGHGKFVSLAEGGLCA